MKRGFSSIVTRGRRVSAATNVVRNALSQRRAEFGPEMHRIEGEVNSQGGSIASLSSGLFVARFAEEIRLELQKRSKIAGKALGDALRLQERHVGAATAGELRDSVSRVVAEDAGDLREWYQRRVHDANPEIAANSPFKPMFEDALHGVFVELENRALAPGFWSRNLDRIIAGFIGILIGLLGNWLTRLLR